MKVRACYPILPKSWGWFVSSVVTLSALSSTASVLWAVWLETVSATSVEHTSQSGCKILIQILGLYPILIWPDTGFRYYTLIVFRCPKFFCSFKVCIIYTIVHWISGYPASRIFSKWNQISGQIPGIRKGRISIMNELYIRGSTYT